VEGARRIAARSPAATRNACRRWSTLAC